MFNWIDIGLHVLVATPLALVARHVADLGEGREEGRRHALGLIASLIAIAATVLWPLRELLQHGGRWGGMQSQLEWIAPVLAVVIVTCLPRIGTRSLSATGKPISTQSSMF